MFKEGKRKLFYFFVWFLSLWRLFQVCAKAPSCDSSPVTEGQVSSWLLKQRLQCLHKTLVLQAEVKVCMWQPQIMGHHTYASWSLYWGLLNFYLEIIFNTIETQVFLTALWAEKIYFILWHASAILSWVVPPWMMITHLGKVLSIFCLVCHVLSLVRSLILFSHSFPHTVLHH